MFKHPGVSPSVIGGRGRREREQQRKHTGDIKLGNKRSINKTIFYKSVIVLLLLLILTSADNNNYTLLKLQLNCVRNNLAEIVSMR